MPENSLEIYEGDYFSGSTHGFGYTDYDRDKQAMIPTFNKYLRRIARYTAPAPGKRLLDVGAATGFFLDLARQAGWDTAGIEPAESAAAVARGKNLDVKTGILESDLYMESSFDVITLWDVLEHLPDPLTTMRLITALLKPNGVVAINTPDSSSLWSKLMGTRWHMLCPPEHLCLFGTRSFDRMLGEIGLKLLERDKIGKSFTMQYVAQTLANWQGGALWGTVAQRLQKSRVGRWGVPINLRDNVFLLARKLAS